MTTKPKTPAPKQQAGPEKPAKAVAQKQKANPPAKKPASKSARKAAAAKPGRPSGFTEAIAAAICDAIADGSSLIDICKSDEMPSAKTVYAWLADDARLEFRNRYAGAREAQADKLATEILQISDDGRNDTQKDEDGKVLVDHDVIARSRLRVDSRKWLAGKLAPKKYGDKLALGGADDLPPIQTRAMTDAERAVRMSRMLNDSPELMACLLSAIQGKKP